MSQAERKERVEVVLDVPEDIRINLRRGVFRVMGELSLGSPESPISVLQKNIDKVTAFVKGQIPDVEIVDEDGRKIFRKKPEELTLEPESEVVPEPVGKKEPDGVTRVSFSSQDGPVGEYWQLHREADDRRKYYMQVALPEAKARALKASKSPGSRRWVPEIVRVFQERFQYRGENTSIYEEGTKIKSVTAIRKWKREIDKRKGRLRR